MVQRLAPFVGAILFVLLALILLIGFLVQKNSLVQPVEYVECPEGTFVKKLQWSTLSYIFMRSGITLECCKPEHQVDSEYSTILTTHHGASIPPLSERLCAAVHGITVMNDKNGFPTGLDVTFDCYAGPSEGNKLNCGRNSAMVALAAEIQQPSQNLKSLEIRCRDVDDIAEICLPLEEKQRLLTCDATHATASMLCTYEKTNGVGLVSVMSDSQRNEFQFYVQLGFDINKSLYKLYTNFKLSIGLSQTTNHNWDSFEESTWKGSYTTIVEIEALPGCQTVINEIIGSCSFLAVRPLYFERVDICNGVAMESHKIQGVILLSIVLISFSL